MLKSAVIYLLFYLDRPLKIWLAPLWICLGSGNRGVCISAYVASPQVEADRKCSYNLHWKASQDTAESSSCTTDRSSFQYCMFQSICITTFNVALLCAVGSGPSKLFMSSSLMRSQKYQLSVLKQQNWARRILCRNCIFHYLLKSYFHFMV